MLYINKDTGIVLDFSCKVSGGSWEPVSNVDTPQNTTENTTKPKAKRQAKKQDELRDDE